MKTPSLVIFGGSLILLAGCATNTTKLANDTEQKIKANTGKPIRWIRGEKEEAEVKRAIESLLQQELTADSAVQIALLNNRSLQAELEEIGIAQADLIQAGLLKNIQFSGSWRFPLSPPSAANTEYSVAGDFLDLLILPLRKKVAAQNLEATTLRVSGSVLQLAAEVRAAFYTLQARKQLLNRFKLIVDVNEAASDVAKKQSDAGNITDLDLTTQQAIYAQSRVAVAQTEKQIRQDRERLNRLLGLWGENTNWKIADSLPEIPGKEISFDHLETLAIQQRLDLAAGQRRLNNVGYALALRTKTRYLPASVNLGVSSERDPDKQWVVGPTLDLELPIFDRGQGAIARLQSEYRQALRQLEALAVNIRSEVRQARDEIIANRDLAEYYGKILLPQRIRIVNESLLQYNAMQIGAIQLLTAKEQEVQTERDYIEAWRDYWIAHSELERAVGGHLRIIEAKPMKMEKQISPAKSEEKKSEPHNHQH